MMKTFFVLFFTASAALSQVQRTFVSAKTGSDSNSCGVTAPCRSFGTALAATLSGGEIIVLDSGGYGVVTIDKSVSIISPPGVYAGISAFSSSAININTPSLTVVLEGLTLNGLGAAGGISATQPGTVYVRRCLIAGFGIVGITLSVPPGLGTQSIFLSVADSWIRNNSSQGIYAYSQSGIIHVVLDRVHIDKNFDGVNLDTNAELDAYASVFAANSNTALTAAGSATLANFESCLFSNNNIGVTATYGTVRISNCTITDNVIGVYGPLNPAGRIYSRQNNTIEGNGSDDTPTAYTGK